MSERPAVPPGQVAPGWFELLWRWACFGVLPFLAALTAAMAITASAETSGQGSPAVPAGPGSAPTLARLMNLSPVPERAAPGFTLTDQRGRRVSLAGFRGKAVLLAFMDSRCTEVCPVIAQELIAAYHDLGPRARQVAFAAVNVNPAANSVAAVKRFTEVHGLSELPNWYFLTGPARDLAAVWRAYGIEVLLPPGASQTVHQDFIIFVNPMGRERFLAEPFADQRSNGTGYLPSGTIQRWGQGIARYLEQAEAG